MLRFISANYWHFDEACWTCSCFRVQFWYFTVFAFADVRFAMSLSGVLIWFQFIEFIATYTVLFAMEGAELIINVLAVWTLAQTVNAFSWVSTHKFSVVTTFTLWSAVFSTSTRWFCKKAQNKILRGLGQICMEPYCRMVAVNIACIILIINITDSPDTFTHSSFDTFSTSFFFFRNKARFTWLALRGHRCNQGRCMKRVETNRNKNVQPIVQRVKTQALLQ